jgi:hypothetical protein
MVFSIVLITKCRALCLEQNDVLILLNEGVTFKEIRESLDESGINPSIFFSPNSVYINDYKGDIGELEDNGMIKSLFISNIDVTAVDFTQDEKVALNFFNYKKELDAGIIDERVRTSPSGILTQPKDFLRHGKRAKMAYPVGIDKLAYFQKPADFYFTSEYLIGDIAVAIILPESDGSLDVSTEDWDDDRIDAVLNAINKVLAWWINRVTGTPMAANLTFYVKTYIKTPTKYEIINLTSGGPLTEELLWMYDVMANLGYDKETYPDYDYLDMAFAFNNNLRNGIEDSDIQTDWAITFFIIDSFNDVDGKFVNDSFAYSYGGGPFTVLTYDNENYGIDRMWEVAVHEMAHQFYALDEYAIALEPCDTVSGYLAFQNQNSEYNGGCLTDVLCMMQDLGREIFNYNDSRLICGYSRGQVGWGDDDGDSVFDPVDTVPILTIDPYEEGAQEFSGMAEVITTPNLNPLAYPKGVERIDITTNKIVIIQYRLDQELWVDIIPDDLELGGMTETFNFNPYPPMTGNYTLEVKVVNSVGNETREIVGENIFLESFASNDRTSLCFLAQAAFCDNNESSDFLKVLNRILKILHLIS